MTDPILKKEADTIKAKLGPYDPTYAQLSEAEVLKRALNDPLVSEGTKQRWRDTFSDGFGMSLVKGVGRGLGLDLVGKVADYTPTGMIANWAAKKINPSAPSMGEGISSMLNIDPLQDGWGKAGEIIGNVGGTAAATLIPGLNLAKAGTLAKVVGNAAVGGALGTSQAIGQQENEIALGDRLARDPKMVAASGLTSALGGAALPATLSWQAASTGGKLLRPAKIVAKGAISGAGEAAMDAGLSTGLRDDQKLSISGAENAPGAGEAMIAGGIMGGLLGGGFELAGGIPSASQALPRHSSVGQRATPPPTPRTTPTPVPTMQGLGWDPQRISSTAYKISEEFLETPEYAEGVARGVGESMQSQLTDAVMASLEKLSSGPSREMAIDRRTGKHLVIDRLPEFKKWLVIDPESGATRLVPYGAFKQNTDRLVLRGRPGNTTAYTYPGEHRRVPKQGAGMAFTYQGEAYKPISFRKAGDDIAEIGAVPVNAVQTGMNNAVVTLPADDQMLVGSAPYIDALKLALQMEEAPGATPGSMRWKPWDSYPELSTMPEFMEKDFPRIPKGVEQLEDLLNRHTRKVRQ